MAGSLVLLKHQAPPRWGGVGPDGIGFFTVKGTADAADGSFPATALSDIETEDGAPGNLTLSGTFLTVATDPGTPAPTSGWSVALFDDKGLDRFGGRANTRSSGSSQSAPVSGFAGLSETLTLTVTGNTELEAEVTITVFYSTAAILAGWSIDADGDLLVHDPDALIELMTLSSAIHPEDDVHASTDGGLFTLNIANEAGVDLVDADGDYVGQATTLKGEAYVRPSIRSVPFTWTPTLDTSAYTAGDNLYTTLYEIPNVGRYNGASGRIVDFFVRDGDKQSKQCELHVFDRSVTIPAANAAWSISDSDNQYRACGVINSGQWYDNTLNSSSSNPALSVPFHCKSDSRSLWVAVVTREAPTYTASGVMFGIRVELD